MARAVSRGTARLIDWELIQQGLPGVLATAVSTPAAEVSDEEYIRRVRDTFGRVRESFKEVMTKINGPVNRVVIVAFAVLVVAFAVSVGLALYQQAALWAAVPNLAGAAAIYALISKFRTLLQDQKYLLIPDRYEVALTFCRDRKQVEELVGRFLEETKPWDNMLEG